MPEELSHNERIHHPERKGESAGTFSGELQGEPVIIKRGPTPALAKERTILDKIDHAGVPKVRSFQKEIDGSAELVMERIEGDSLRSQIALDANWHSQPVKLSEGVGIVQGLADCFEAVNRAGYIYRDLNLDHILVSESGAVGLVDLEACAVKSQDGEAKMDSEDGTWETMAPEEFRVGNNITEAANVYTLGIVTKQVFTGKNPFFIPAELESNEASRRKMTFVHHAMGLDFPPFKGTVLAGVIEKALQPDPALRYQTVAEFKQALEAATVTS